MVAHTFCSGPSGQGWADRRSQDTHAEVLFGFIFASIFQAWGSKTRSRSICAAVWIQSIHQKGAGSFLSQDWRMQQGNKILCPIKIYFSQKMSICVNVSVSETGIDSHCDTSLRDPCQPGIQKADKSLMINCNQLLLQRLDTHLLQM